MKTSNISRLWLVVPILVAVLVGVGIVLAGTREPDAARAVGSMQPVGMSTPF